MAISRGQELVSQSNPNPDEIRKSIAALKKETNYVQKCINAGLRDYISGQKVLDEITNIIQRLEEKL
jgi:DNA-binding NarL/FixJ family response regulator